MTVEARASAEVEKSTLPVASTDDEPYAIVPCVRDAANGSAPYSACTCTPSVSIQSMALGTTVPCTAIDEPLTSTRPVASTDDEPYAIVPCVRDTAKGSAPYSACTCTPSVSIQSMAVGITVPCTAIDEPLTSCLLYTSPSPRD